MTASRTMTSQDRETPLSNRGFNAQFLSAVPRYQPLQLHGAVASVDSVRLKFVFSATCYDFDKRERTDTLVRVMYALTDLTLWDEHLFDIRTAPERNFKCGQYEHRVDYSHPDGWSFSVLVGRFCTSSSADGAGFNSARSIAAEAVMDFNPNKVPRRAWERVAGILRSYAASKPTVARYDLAVDFPLERDSLSLQPRPGSEYKQFRDKEGHLTEYIGERSHHAAIKLYDKGAEVGADTPISRLEFTISPKQYKGLASLFPTITTTAPLEISTDFSALPFQVQAVLIHPDLYQLLKAKVSGNTWRKYEDMIRQYSRENGQTVLELSTEDMAAIDNYTRDYFLHMTTGKE